MHINNKQLHVDHYYKKSIITRKAGSTLKINKNIEGIFYIKDIKLSFELIRSSQS